MTDDDQHHEPVRPDWMAADLPPGLGLSDAELSEIAGRALTMALFTMGPADAKEVAARTMAALVKHLDTQPAPDNMDAWLRTVTARGRYQLLRDKYRARHLEERLAAEPVLHTIDTAESVVAAEAAAQLIDAIQKLPSKQRQAMVDLIDGATTKESAEAMGVSLETVKTHRARARAALQQTILQQEAGSA